MKALIKAGISENKITTSKRCGNRLLKFIMLVFVIASLTLLSSCFVGPPRMGHEGHSENYGHHDNGRHNGGGAHHGGGEHHDRD
jgi:hypothetical protein